METESKSSRFSFKAVASLTVGFVTSATILLSLYDSGFDGPLKRAGYSVEETSTLICWRQNGTTKTFHDVSSFVPQGSDPVQVRILKEKEGNPLLGGYNLVSTLSDVAACKLTRTYTSDDISREQETAAAIVTMTLPSGATIKENYTEHSNLPISSSTLSVLRAEPAFLKFGEIDLLNESLLDSFMRIVDAFFDFSGPELKVVKTLRVQMESDPASVNSTSANPPQRRP